MVKRYLIICTNAMSLQLCALFPKSSSLWFCEYGFFSKSFDHSHAIIRNWNVSLQAKSWRLRHAVICRRFWSRDDRSTNQLLICVRLSTAQAMKLVASYSGGHDGLQTVDDFVPWITDVAPPLSHQNLDKNSDDNWKMMLYIYIYIYWKVDESVCN